MENENKVVVPETTEEVTPEVTPEENEVDWKSEAEKAKELANNYKIRAEKAEKKSKEVPRTETRVQSEGDLSSTDTIAIMRAGVHEEDIETLKKYSKMSDVSITDALKQDELKAMLYVRHEKRQTANATNTGQTRRSSQKISDDVLLEKASKGEFPENDSDISRLVRLQAESKRPKKRS